MTERVVWLIVGAMFMFLGLVGTMLVGRHYHGDPAVLFGAAGGCAFGYGVAIVAGVARAAMSTDGEGR